MSEKDIIITEIYNNKVFIGAIVNKLSKMKLTDSRLADDVMQEVIIQLMKIDDKKLIDMWRSDKKRVYGLVHKLIKLSFVYKKRSDNSGVKFYPNQSFVFSVLYASNLSNYKDENDEEPIKCRKDSIMTDDVNYSQEVLKLIRRKLSGDDLNFLQNHLKNKPRMTTPYKLKFNSLIERIRLIIEENKNLL